MLPPFRIRSLHFSGSPKASLDNLVRINAPCYDEIISSHPAATLKYFDEDDRDLITLGSSRELAEKLEEPLTQPSSGVSAILQHDLQLSEYHVFEIDDRDDVRKLWQDRKESQNVSVAENLADAAKWSAEKKNRLAIFYEQRRAEIWNPIAEELGVTWQCVDAMHWALGKEEMTRRAYTLDHRSEQSGSAEKVAKRTLHCTYITPDTQKLEDYRVHHFNATQPPQVQLQMPVTHQSVKATAGQATVPKVSTVDLDRSASPTTGNIVQVHLTNEDKSQAQAVGDKLRSRMTAVDNHQKRWANYKSSISAFLPKASTSVSLAFDGPGLTLEGKRQAQVAGDKLRCRTNPIRHSRPEHCISKNRWSSYSGTRPTRFDERKNAQDEAKETADTADTEEVPKDSQPSLLEVFEEELAKKISAPDSEEAPQLGSPVLQAPLPEPALQVDPSRESQGQPLPQGSHALLGHLNERLYELSARDVALSREFSTAIDRGIRGLSACIQNVARGLQEVSSVSRQAAVITRSVDSQLIDDAVLGFRSLTAGFAAVLGGDMAAHRPETTSAPRNRSEEVETCLDSFSHGISHDNDPKENAITAHKNNQSPLDGSDNQMALDTVPGSAPVLRYISAESASPQLDMRSRPSSGPAMGEKPWFHTPGPTRLLHRPGYVDRLRRSQSTDLFEEQCDFQRAMSPPPEIHFPTLPQFDRDNSGASQAFPALPGMEPLIPQRASCQQIYDTKAGIYGSTNDNSSVESLSNSADASCGYHSLVADRQEHFASRNEHEAIPPSPLSSAARLAGPFDPLEVEPSARSHLTEGLRRNATTATTDIRHAERRRRPYSEVFDGVGRVPWGAFLQDNRRERSSLYRPSGDRGRPLGVNQERPKRPFRPDRESRRSPFAPAGYDDQHHDDSTVGKINDCVEQLRDLGFGTGDNVSAGRLLVYAQAADGVLGDAIDLIDEEQRAWQRL